MRRRRTNGDMRDINRFGGGTVQGINATIEHMTSGQHRGKGAFQIETNAPIAQNGFDFVGISTTGFHDGEIDTRDITPFGTLQFWVRNTTGSAFTLVFEIKDYRDSNDHRARMAIAIDSEDEWVPIRVPLSLARPGWQIVGQPDLSRTKLFALVIEANQGVSVNGTIYLDDMILIERGSALNPQTASVRELLTRLSQRQFQGLWGARDRSTGLLPNISAHAEVMALNVTAGLVKLLPIAIERGWITASAANDYVTQLLETLNTLMESAQFVPPRYVDRVTLEPTSLEEESPVDAAFMFLSLYEYRFLPTTPGSLRTAIDEVMGQFDFRAFSSAEGWRLAYRYSGGFTAEIYEGYSGEVWLISLAAHLVRGHHVDITRHDNSGVLRVAGPDDEIVYTNEANRPPFVQWLMDLFVNTKDRGSDTFPDAELATNPHLNAVRYQRAVDAELASLGRDLFLQPDAADDGTCDNYEQFSKYEDFGQPGLFMPWSVAFAFLGDRSAAEAALRNTLKFDLHGPLGLSDSAVWETGKNRLTSLPARQDFWNVTLATMALTQYLFHTNEFLATLPRVEAALDKVFVQPIVDASSHKASPAELIYSADVANRWSSFAGPSGARGFEAGSALLVRPTVAGVRAAVLLDPPDVERVFSSPTTEFEAQNTREAAQAVVEEWLDEVLAMT